MTNLQYFYFFVALMIPAAMSLLTINLFGKRRILNISENTFIAVAITGLFRAMALCLPILICAIFLDVLFFNSNFDLSLDTETFISCIVTGATFCMYFYNGCYRLLFNSNDELTNIMHILLCEYNFCQKSADNREQIIKWMENVYSELRRFGLEDSMVAKHLAVLIYDEDGHPRKNYIRRLLRIRKKHENIFLETNDIEMVVTALLILAGDKKVDDFVPVSATIVATKASEKKKILHVTKKRPCDASENTRCSDDG